MTECGGKDENTDGGAGMLVSGCRGEGDVEWTWRRKLPYKYVFPFSLVVVEAKQEDKE